MARLVSLGILVLIIIVLGVMFYHVVAPFLLPLFLAGVVSLLFRPIYRRLLAKLEGGRETLAAGLTTAIALATFLIPVVLGIFFAAGELLILAHQIRNSEEVRQMIESLQTDPWMEQVAHEIQPFLGPNADEKQIAEEIGEAVENAATTIAQKTLGMAGAAISFIGNFVMGIISMGMFIIALFFFLRDGPRLLEASQQLIPVNIDHQTQILLQFEKSVRAVVSSTFMAAIAQGFFTALALYFLGFHKAFLIFFLATFFAMIPLAGAPVVWVPCAVWLGYQGYWGSCIFLVLYGGIFIGMLDNLIRTYILHSDVKLHPLLAFISVLGGVQAMGLWGIFIAPIVASCLHALILIANSELKELSKDQFQVFKKGSNKKGKNKSAANHSESDVENSEINQTTPEESHSDVETPETTETPAETDVSTTEKTEPKNKPRGPRKDRHKRHKKHRKKRG